MRINNLSDEDILNGNVGKNYFHKYDITQRSKKYILQIKKIKDYLSFFV